MVFYTFCYYFWGQHCCWTETSMIDKDFFALYKFPSPSTLLLPSLLYRCSGVPGDCSNWLESGIFIAWLGLIYVVYDNAMNSPETHFNRFLMSRIWRLVTRPHANATDAAEGMFRRQKFKVNPFFTVLLSVTITKSKSRTANLKASPTTRTTNRKA